MIAKAIEALRTATPQDLREDARLLLDVFSEVTPSNREDTAWLRAAALALVVAEQQEHNGEAFLHDSMRGTWAIGRTFSATAERGSTLPAALAAYLAAKGGA